MFNDMSFNFYKMLWISQQTGRVGYCLILAVCLMLFKIWATCGFVLGPRLSHSIAFSHHFPNSNVKLHQLHQIAITWTHPIFRHAQIPTPTQNHPTSIGALATGWPDLFKPRRRRQDGKTQRNRRSELEIHLSQSSILVCYSIRHNLKIRITSKWLEHPKNLFLFMIFRGFSYQSKIAETEPPICQPVSN